MWGQHNEINYDIICQVMNSPMKKINNQQKRDREWQGVGEGGISFIYL